MKEFEGPEEERVKAEIAERILRKRQLVDAFGSKRSKRNVSDSGALHSIQNWHVDWTGRKRKAERLKNMKFEESMYP